MNIEPELLNEKQACKFLTLNIRTLQNWRGIGKGPAFIKLGTGPKAAVRYRQSELTRFINAGEITRAAA